MKNEHTSSTAPLLIGMAAGAALGAAGVMATNTSQRQMRRTARKIAKGAEHAVSQLDKMVGDFVEHKMEADGPRIAQKGRDRGFSPAPAFCCSKKQQSWTNPNLSGQVPSILLVQDRSVAQKPHWGFRCFANANFFLCNQRSRCPQIGRFGCHPCIYSRWFLYRRCIFLSAHSRICPSMDSSR